MSLDNIKLPAFVHQSMFRNKLVSVDKTSDDQFSNDVFKIDFLGGNKKKIVFVAEENKNKYLDDIDLKFLQGLIAACKLNIDDIALINISKNKSVSYREITTQLNAVKVLMFGITTHNLDLPFQIPFFQVQNFQEQQYMLGPSFQKLQEDTCLKKQLWICLQKIFNL